MHHQSILKLLWFSKQKLQETMHLYISNYVRVFKNKMRLSIDLWKKQQQSHKFPPWIQYFALFWYFSTVNGNLISSSMKTKTSILDGETILLHFHIHYGNSFIFIVLYMKLYSHSYILIYLIHSFLKTIRYPYHI